MGDEGKETVWGVSSKSHNSPQWGVEEKRDEQSVKLRKQSGTIGLDVDLKSFIQKKAQRHNLPH